MSCNCQGTPFPKMYVVKSVTDARKTLFMNNQYNILSGIVPGETTSVLYGANDFISMLHFLGSSQPQGIRFYFASYGDEGTVLVPKGYGHKMTIIITPIDAQYNDGKYYWIAPGGSFNPSRSELDPVLAQAWIDNYKKVKLPALSLNIEHIPDNQDQNGNYTDTVSIWHKMANLADFSSEIQCQFADGVKANFATILSTEHRYQKRMIVQFSLTDPDGNDIYIDEDPTCRPQVPQTKDYDTGNPCPPATNCTGH